MITITLDVHKELCQMVAYSHSTGEVFFETKVGTNAEELRKVIGAVKGKKRVVFEEGPMSGLIKDALKGIVDEVVSSDPTKNALIAQSEDSNDEKDARRLLTLMLAGEIRPVYVPSEPFRTLRSLLQHDGSLCKTLSGVKNRLKALCRRNGIKTRGTKPYRSSGRDQVIEKLPNAALRWQMECLYRELDMYRAERVAVHRVMSRHVGNSDVLKRLETIPGIKKNLSKILYAWIVDPDRFKSRSALVAYAGLGIGQGFTNWHPVGRAHASKRGNRELKRALLLAAQAAINGDNALSRRYKARLDAGWDVSKAKRDIAKEILFIASAMWKKGKAYDDARVSVPDIKRDGP